MPKLLNYYLGGRFSHVSFAKPRQRQRATAGMIEARAVGVVTEAVVTEAAAVAIEVAVGAAVR